MDRLYGFYTSGQMRILLSKFALSEVSISLPLLVCVCASFLSLVLLWRLRQRRYGHTYLLDFSCYKTPDELKSTRARMVAGLRSNHVQDDSGIEFQEKILFRSGLGDETALPRGFYVNPVQLNRSNAMEEAQWVMFGCVQDLLNKTGIHPRQIDVLVTNCSLFCPTPSLAAMIINKFKMRSDVQAYNLGGMGCSISPVAVAMASRVLNAVRPSGGYAVVMSFENVTAGAYTGNDRSMLLPNIIFKMGGAAILITNHPRERRRAKYQMSNFVSVHGAADDTAFNVIRSQQDKDGKVGTYLGKEVPKVGGKMLTKCMVRLGPQVLPITEKINVALNLIARKVLGLKVLPYTPDFKKAFDHFCVHAGGRAVLEGVGSVMELPSSKLAASYNSLYWYGNTSSSSIWYEMAFVETMQGVKKGEKVWQIGLGSGFKCNSMVWRALRNIKTQHPAWSHLCNSKVEKVVDPSTGVVRLLRDKIPPWLNYTQWDADNWHRRKEGQAYECEVPPRDNRIVHDSIAATDVAWRSTN